MTRTKTVSSLDEWSEYMQTHPTAAETIAAGHLARQATRRLGAEPGALIRLVRGRDLARMIDVLTIETRQSQRYYGEAFDIPDINHLEHVNAWLDGEL